MAQYLLSVWHDDPDAVYSEPMEDMQDVFEAVDAFNQKIMANGQWVFGGGLENPNNATVIRPTDGNVVVTDGPYSEVKEGFGGFWVIDVADHDQAVALAKEAALACRGAVELRPFQAEPES